MNIDPEAIELAVLRDVLNLVLLYSSVLISIFLAILLAVGYGIYRFVGWRLSKQTEAAAGKEMRRTMARLYAGIGWSYWQRYEQTRSSEQLELAINMTRRALELHASKLDDRIAADEEIICHIRNDLAWYLAQRGTPEDQGLAWECIKYTHDRMHKYEERRKTWEDTYRFVSRKYPEK